MKMENKIKQKIYIGLLLTVVMIIGISYAYFFLRKEQTNSNIIGTRNCLNTTLTEDTSEIILTDAFPISDERGINKEPFTFTLTNNCDSYVEYEIALFSNYRESTDTQYLKDDYVKVNLSNKETTEESSNVLSTLKLKQIDTNREGYVLKTEGLKAHASKSYDLRLWLNSQTTLEQGLNKTWRGKIVVTITAAKRLPEPDGWNEASDGTLLAAIKRDNTVTETLTQPGTEPSAYTLDDAEVQIGTMSSTSQNYYITYGTGWEANGTKFNLTGTAVTSDTYANSYSTLVGKYLTSSYLSTAGSSTAGTMKTTTDLSAVYYVISAASDIFTYKKLTSNKNATEAVLASTKDDYGTSYYFRGAVINNFVEYANMCWRIVRVTGDGSIKLVLYNYNRLTSTNNTPSSSTPCNVTGDYLALARYEGDTYRSVFNDDYNGNAYVGFMYGTAGGASSYTTTHANTNPSTILTNLNKWYTNVLSKQANFNDSQLADTIWCNDKSVVTDTTFNPSSMTLGTNYGYGQNRNYYGAAKRLVQASSWSAGGTGPSLICPNDNNGGKLSKFTVSDTENGNGALKNYAKIGLLTADEIAFAGGAYDTTNPIYYINGNTYDWWWALSPNVFGGSYAIVWEAGGSNSDFKVGFVENGSGVRPSLSLQSGVKISSGIGSATNPYKIAD